MSQQSEKPVKGDPAVIQRETTNPVLTSADALRPEDFYWDGPYLVFTEAYHLRRGYCCNSGCRHCPYK